ncbi:MAG: HAD hydrolase-like protein [Candidatus Micrarchaeota archaeon]|nr:HAD hydrolase-like protein [Candidatus Micrarchaeota archaeon]
MISAIFFDLDNTLFPTNEFAEKARRKAINAMIREGLPLKKEEAYARLLRIIKKFGSNYGHQFDVLVRGALGKNSARIVAAGIAAYHDSKSEIKTFEGVGGTLTKLRRGGHKLFVVSEGMPVKQWDKLIRLGLKDEFDGVFVTGSGRKNRKFYESVLEKGGARACESLMVGDRCDRDMEPAKAAGMLACQAVFTGQPRCKKADFAIKKFEELCGLVERVG